MLIKLIALVLLSVAALNWSLSTTPLTAAHAQAFQLPDQARVEQNKKTIFARLKRDKVAYRGDKPGQIRIKWEWVNQVLSNYVFHKRSLLRELSAGEKYELRDRWVYKDMKCTFQEIYALGPEDDDKLFPLSRYNWLLDLAANHTFEGLTLLGKQGEEKGRFKTKVVVNGFYGYNFISSLLRYEDKEDKERLAWGIAEDAYTLRWKDLKQRIADDMSEEKALEDIRLERDKISADTVREQSK